MKRSLLILAALGAVAGCATPPPRFVPSVPYTARPSRTPDQVNLYYHEKDVPYPYVELGRVFLTVDPGLLADPAEQIRRIRIKAAEIGADAVILAPMPASFAEGSYVGARRGGAGSSYEYGGTMYTGTAVIKK